MLVICEILTSKLEIPEGGDDVLYDVLNLSRKTCFVFLQKLAYFT